MNSLSPHQHGQNQLDFQSIHEAAQRIRPFAHRTPVLTSEALNRAAGLEVFLKCEHLQKVGAFKFRGACNAVFNLTEEQARRGVIAHSSGNHAQALALAARLRGIQAHIVMPRNAPQVKKSAVCEYGASITFCEPTLEARELTQLEIVKSTGATVIHPYDNELVIAGQATAAVELLEDHPEMDFLMAPVGGGGLLAGTALAARFLSTGTRVVGAEPQMADDAFRSFAAGYIIPSVSPQTIADGLQTSVGELNFPIIRAWVDSIFTVSEESIVQAMRFMWERTKQLIEPSAAVPIAVLLEGRLAGKAKKVGVILSGGNTDLNSLPW